MEQNTAKKNAEKENVIFPNREEPEYSDKDDEEPELQALQSRSASDVSKEMELTPSPDLKELPAPRPLDASRLTPSPRMHSPDLYNLQPPIPSNMQILATESANNQQTLSKRLTLSSTIMELRSNITKDAYTSSNQKKTENNKKQNAKEDASKELQLQENSCQPTTSIGKKSHKINNEAKTDAAESCSSIKARSRTTKRKISGKRRTQTRALTKIAAYDLESTPSSELSELTSEPIEPPKRNKPSNKRLLSSAGRPARMKLLPRLYSPTRSDIPILAGAQLLGVDVAGPSTARQRSPYNNRAQKNSLRSRVLVTPERHSPPGIQARRALPIPGGKRQKLPGGKRNGWLLKTARRQNNRKQGSDTTSTTSESEDENDDLAQSEYSHSDDDENDDNNGGGSAGVAGGSGGKGGSLYKGSCGGRKGGGSGRSGGRGNRGEPKCIQGLSRRSFCPFNKKGKENKSTKVAIHTRFTHICFILLSILSVKVLADTVCY